VSQQQLTGETSQKEPQLQEEGEQSARRGDEDMRRRPIKLPVRGTSLDRPSCRLMEPRLPPLSTCEGRRGGGEVDV